MIPAIRVEVDIRDAVKKLRKIRSQAIPRAAARALNRARDTARTEVVRDVARQLGVAQKPIRKRVFRRTQVNARPTRIQASVKFGTLPIALDKLGRVKETGAGVRVGMLPIVEGAFVATMPSGHVGAYQRYGERVSVVTPDGPRRKQRIEKVTYDIGPLLERSARKLVKAVGLRAFRKRYAHELNRELRKIGAR